MPFLPLKWFQPATPSSADGVACQGMKRCSLEALQRGYEKKSKEAADARVEMLEGLDDLISKEQGEVRAAEKTLKQKKLALDELLARKAGYTDPTDIQDAGAAPVPALAPALDAAADAVVTAVAAGVDPTDNIGASGADSGGGGVPCAAPVPTTAAAAAATAPTATVHAAAAMGTARTPTAASATAGDTYDSDTHPNARGGNGFIPETATSISSSSPVQDATAAISGGAVEPHAEFDKEYENGRLHMVLKKLQGETSYGIEQKYVHHVTLAQLAVHHRKVQIKNTGVLAEVAGYLRRKKNGETSNLNNLHYFYVKHSFYEYGGAWVLLQVDGPLMEPSGTVVGEGGPGHDVERIKVLLREGGKVSVFERMVFELTRPLVA